DWGRIQSRTGMCKAQLKAKIHPSAPPEDAKFELSWGLSLTQPRMQESGQPEDALRRRRRARSVG
ncbi:MAG: hypothetical protein ACRD27_11720, partial [Terracidiphilus sp.]